MDDPTVQNESGTGDDRMATAQAERTPSAAGKVVSFAFRGFLVLIVLAIGVGVFGALAASRTSPERTEGEGVLMSVLTMEASPAPVARTWSGYGTARSMRAIDVASEVSARVEQRPDRIEAGQSVRAGDVLVRLDATDFEQRVEQSQRAVESLEAQLSSLEIEERRTREQADLAEQQAEIASREYERAVEAFDNGAGSQTEVEARLTQSMSASRDAASLAQRTEQIPARRAALQADLAAQKARRTIDQTDLERTTIVSPIDGVLQDVFVRAGERLSPGEPVARVVDLSRIETPVRLPLGAQRDVRIGSEVQIMTDGEGSRTWSGIVSRIAPEADASTRSFTVFVEVTQDAGAEVIASAQGRLLLPGQFVVAKVTTNSDSRRLVVPRRSVSGDRVLIARNEDDRWIARSVAIDVGFAMDGKLPGLHPTETQWIVVQGGLNEGDRVIVSNLDAVQDGSSLDIAPVLGMAERLGAGGGGL